MCEAGFVISTTTQVSNADIRSVLAKVIVNGKEYWLCGDRNRFLHTYTLDDNQVMYRRVSSFKGHEGVITTIFNLKPCDWFPDGAILTASDDKTINAWSLDQITQLATTESIVPMVTLIGHEDRVCYVTATDDGTIISTSWDSTCRIWKSPEDPIVLRHEQFAIWAAVDTPQGYVTLGADKTLRLWSKEGKELCKHENAHTDVLRDGLYIKDRQILVTVANDGYIKEWRIENNSFVEIKSIMVSDKYLYSISRMDDFTFVVSGEDKAAYVVNSARGAVTDFVPLTGVVWSVDVLQNGDIIAGCNDGFVRTFTFHSERRAPADIEEAYIASLKALTFNNPDFESINILDLPSLSEIQSEPGQPGQPGVGRLIRDGENMIIVAWSQGYQRYLEIGTLTKTKGNQMQKAYDENGKEWDFSFTIELEDGNSYPIYLNYDTNEFIAARDFLLKHKLPVYFMDQIANFIRRERKPYMVNMDQQKKPVSSIFPLITPVYIDQINIAPIIGKLKKSNNNNLVLSEEQFNILENESSTNWFNIVSEVALNWPVDQSWPLMDILRAKLLESNSRSYISPAGLLEIIRHIANDPCINDFAILTLMRICANMFKNYSGEAMGDAKLNLMFQMLSLRYPALSPRTQIAFSTAVLNYSIYLESNPNAATELMDILINIISTQMDEEALYRILYATGNCLVFSPAALTALRNRPDVIDGVRSSVQSQRIKDVIQPIIDLLA